MERWRPEDDRPEIIAGTFAWQPQPPVLALTIDAAKNLAEAAAVDEEP